MREIHDFLNHLQIWEHLITCPKPEYPFLSLRWHFLRCEGARSIDKAPWEDKTRLRGRLTGTLIQSSTTKFASVSHEIPLLLVIFFKRSIKIVIFFIRKNAKSCIFSKDLLKESHQPIWHSVKLLFRRHSVKWSVNSTANVVNTFNYDHFWSFKRELCFKRYLCLWCLSILKFWANRFATYQINWLIKQVNQSKTGLQVWVLFTVSLATNGRRSA